MIGFTGRFVAAMILAAAVSVVGCSETHYQIEITPDGEGFERKLTCWRETSSGTPDADPLVEQLPEEKLKRIGSFYERRESDDGAAKQVFAGRFDDTTPADVGGAGKYTRFNSPLGSVSWYVERFRGNDDLEAQLTRRRVAADQLVDLLIGWLKEEVGNREGFAELKTFLDEDFRKDLKNLGIYIWAADVAGKAEAEDATSEFAVRIGLYLCEHDYFALKDIPSMIRPGREKCPDYFLELIKRTFARKMGTAENEPLPECLAVLKDAEELEKALRSYVKTTDAFKRHLEQWHANKKEQGTAVEPQPDDFVLELLFDALCRIELVETEIIDVTLHCDTGPFGTNGDWDEQTATVRWRREIGSDSSLPVMYFAAWSSPAKEVQSRHFGKVVLEGSALAEYVYWYRGLRPEEMREWDEFVASCKPGKKLASSIEKFRFADDQKSGPNRKPVSSADTARKLILQGLDPRYKEEDRVEINLRLRI